MDEENKVEEVITEAEQTAEVAAEPQPVEAEAAEAEAKPQGMATIVGEDPMDNFPQHDENISN